MLYDLQRLLHAELCFALVCWFVILGTRCVVFYNRDAMPSTGVATPILKIRGWDFVGDVVSIVVGIVLLLVLPFHSFTVNLIADVVFAWPALMGLVMCAMAPIRLCHFFTRRRQAQV
ncbi:TPA: hypothetical protein QDB15_000056 [Burkholderia vietnamiensis]|uniref:Transmembrane protein n=1 Tax=Pandoraea apista TaxID=93218 RepID=A0A5E5P3P9_9BURK|nr:MULTISPECIES: hypothetical protein [Burkholderiaceae]MCA8206330.1 hypothetical protein [Burkholderia vietnamiensis]VVG70399.1 hypothetical protein PAP18089_01359 [Pandoraea apista]HDR8943128.1 hypothetical protein [Burkholderia vietnamiensis]HDR9116332.1 hypothetical protein [Burkholderia vietnamiensis]HDR9205378.1 hypothetical protein [Burkholderia vietnamiensis]